MTKNTILIRQLTDFFYKQTMVEMAFLFGSEAKGKAISESDVDIAVWFREPYDDKLAEKLWQEIERLINRNVDLITLNSCRPTIAWAAMRGARLLIRNYKFFIKQLLISSDEAEWLQEFTLDLFALRQKLRGVA